MSLSQLLLLGAIAGYTIFLGLPVARLRKVSESWRVGAGVRRTTLTHYYSGSPG